MRIGVVRESAGEHRVSVVPDAVRRLTGLGAEVLVERGAGEGACCPDADYTQAGARLVTTDAVYAEADVLLSVGAPPGDLAERVHSGQTMVGMFAPRVRTELMAALAAAGATVLSLDGLPRTLSRAQPMDALSSQANVAGYHAVLIAAAAYPRYFPMLITAAGTARPAEVLVLGAGVAGLAAIGTARRLGAVVRAYDVRPASRAEVESVGAEFVELGVGDAEGTGGYARALAADEQRAQQEALAGQVARHDVVITTAQVPGGRPPLLVTAEAVKAMRPGSVIVDLAAGPDGGNVAVSVPERTVRTDNGVCVIGAGNLPSAMPSAASTAYSRNVSALLAHLVTDGELRIDPDDEIQAGVLAVHEGRVLTGGGSR